MLDSKFFATLIGLLVALLAIWNSDFGTSTILENWQGVPQRTVKVMPALKTPNQGMTALNQNYGMMGSNAMYMTPPNFQSSLSPRFMSEGYGANINYNLPSEQYQGVPCNPLTFNNMANENYTRDTNEGFCSGGGCQTVQGCSKGGITPSANLDAKVAASQAASQYGQGPSYEAALDSLQYTDAGSDIPVKDMTVINSLGEYSQPLVYDRYMYANQKSRLHGLGDYIRGDLAIVPCKTGWFAPSVHPQIDLNSGAMAVMGGIDNGTARAMYDLKYRASGGYDDTSGGVNLSDPLIGATQMSGGVSPAMDVSFTAFP